MHECYRSGTVVWCGVCGGYAETKANVLSNKCRGPPPRALGSGGLRQQLVQLRSNRHPTSGLRLPQATRLDGTPITGTGQYRRLVGRASSVLLERTIDEEFKPYEPEELEAAKPRQGQSATTKMQLRANRIRLKAKGERKRRRAVALAELPEVIRTFVNGEPEVGDVGDAWNSQGNSIAGACEEDEGDIDLKKFWDEIVGNANRPQSFNGNVVSAPQNLWERKGKATVSRNLIHATIRR